ncbi:hypothetical protein NCG89_09520 [Spongiibacter taiwanensis]|uniref:hypothetical protein n=1 Tax=Spongiibacter taiwanensis TaxID=1748242 RepID=UPI0020357CCE|nr:hypothetical protein [Spongiibacter taiwanensis]USA41755.1 hypothetical protein NCG89_09520 [Spongiibacter taiwanensis]
MSDVNPGTSKKQVALILAIPVLVVVLSSILFLMAKENVINFGTVNRGTLIRPPVPLPELQLSRNDGSEFMFDLPDSRWLFVVVGGTDCRGACEKMLYLTRQTHIALGKKTNRVERVYLALDGTVSPSLRDFLEREHEDMTILYAPASPFLKAFEHLEINPRDPRAFYVVDPLGWAMMYYRAANTDQLELAALGKDVLKDMKRLLK